MFELTREEYNSLRSQFASLENGRGKHSKYLPFAFTEQGVAMLSSVLNSKKAIQMNIAIVRAFVFVRQLPPNSDAMKQLRALEKKYNKKFKDIYQAIQYLYERDEEEREYKMRRRIGFKRKDED